MKENSKCGIVQKLKRGIELKLFWTDIVWLMSIAAFYFVCLELFYRMMVNYNDRYPSDMRYYSTKINVEPFIADRVVEKISQILYSVNQSIMEFNIYVALVIVGIIVANFLLIRFFLKQDEVLDKVPRHVIQIASLILMFVGPIYFPVLHEWYYRHSFESFAWHSPTQQSMTFFSLIAMLCFYKMYLDYEKGVSRIWWLLTMLTMLISAAVKPNFIMDMTVSVVVVFLIELFMSKREEWTGRFRKLFVMGCSLIPSGIFIIWLNSQEFGEETLNGGEFHVVFGLKPLRDHPDVLNMFVFGMMFSIIVFAANIHRFKDRKYFIGLMLFISGFMQWAFLSETGERAKHGNFSWGRMFGTYFLALICLSLLIENIYGGKSIISENKYAKKIYLALALLVLLLSVISQLNYFRLIVKGNGYML